jgi:hypothetical protein
MVDGAIAIAVFTCAESASVAERKTATDRTVPMFNFLVFNLMAHTFEHSLAEDR